MKYKSMKKRIVSWVVTFVLTFAVAFAAAPAAFATEENENVIRLAGADRYETSAIISLYMHDDDGAEAIVIVNGRDYPDALSAAPFAYSAGASILMVDGPSGIFNPAVAEEIDRIDSNHNADVYIIGGEASVSESVVTQLRTAGYKNITRISGSTRYETAVKVARNIDDKEIAFIANGTNYPDALGGGSAASLYKGAILFTGANRLDQATKNYLEHISFDTVVILGGEGSISKNVESEIRQLQDDVTRVAGADRYQTCLALAEICFEETEMVVAATGTGFADALAGGPFAALYEAPILLVDPARDYISGDIRNYIVGSGAKEAVVLGGKGSVNEGIYSDLESIVK